jgi:putative nucleotidyltransferase with HDIG domain
MISPALAEYGDTLVAAATEVAENSLFAFTNACDEAAFEAVAAPSSGGDGWLRANIEFSGPMIGRFELSVSEPLARHLGAAFAGSESGDDLSDDDLVDFTGEFANMICGTWLTRACRRESFTLSPPRVERRAPKPARPADATTQQFYLAIDEAPIRLEVYWGERNPTTQDAPGLARAAVPVPASRVTAALPAEIVRGIKQLEPMPVTAHRLVAMLGGEDVPLAAIAELVEFDQAIVADVLKMATTVRYGTQTIPTVREAVSRLGTVGLLDLVLAGYLKKLQAATPTYDLTERDLWLHGTAAQLAVRALAAERPQAQIPPIAETAALLHDIGKLVVSRYLKADVRQIVAHARTGGITFVEAERECLGVDHAEVGAAMADMWQFPPDIVHAIRCHHAAPFATPTIVLDTVALANLVAKTIETGLGAEGLNFTVDPGSYSRLGIDSRAFGRVCLQTDEWLGTIARANGVAR